MQIAKPPGGFEIDEPGGIKAAVAAHAGRWPRLPRYWDEIKARLKQTGHREGVLVPGAPAGSRLFIADGDATAGLPTVKVAYLVLGETLYIKMILVVE